VPFTLATLARLHSLATLVVSRLALIEARSPRRVAFAVSLAALCSGVVAPDPSERKGPPGFSGNRGDYMAWFMSFSAYVAYKLVHAAPILDGTLARPSVPAELHGPAAPRPPDPPAAVVDANGAIANQAAINTAEAAIAAWAASPSVVINQAAIDAATREVKEWDALNTQLYGLLVQALPVWLVTSVFNTHRNNGVQAIEYLRTAFDTNHGDGGDHASSLAKIQQRTIDSRSDISEDDLRRHFDMMMTQVAAIARTGNAPPDQKTLIAFYDNALPISYTVMRQHARRSAHATLLAHHTDIMCQVRSEVNARSPAATAFNATGQHWTRQAMVVVALLASEMVAVRPVVPAAPTRTRIVCAAVARVTRAARVVRPSVTALTAAVTTWMTSARVVVAAISPCPNSFAR
jgi:hypothetical protein